jgi:hypothetical protein
MQGLCGFGALDGIIKWLSIQKQIYIQSHSSNTLHLL